MANVNPKPNQPSDLTSDKPTAETDSTESLDTESLDQESVQDDQPTELPQGGQKPIGHPAGPNFNLADLRRPFRLPASPKPKPSSSSPPKAPTAPIKKAADQKQDQKNQTKKLNKEAALKFGSAGLKALLADWTGAAKDALTGAYKLAKGHWREALIALGIVSLMILLGTGIFTAGFTNLLPGSKSGTTFAKSTVNYDTLSQLRQVTAGEQRTRALMIEIQTNGAQGLIGELNNLKTATAESQALTGQELTDFNSLIDETVASLSQLAAIPAVSDQNNAAFLTTLGPIAKNIGQIVETFEKKIFGSANAIGFYNLPPSPFYIRKESNQSAGRQWGRRELILVIANAAREFQKQYPNYKLRITDLSLATGGNMGIGRTVTHKCGLDADITVAHKNNPQSADGVLIIGSGSFSPQMAKDLAEIFFQNGVKMILYQYPYQDYTKFNTTVSGHRNHMHIRISGEWDDFPACLPQKTQ